MSLHITVRGDAEQEHLRTIISRSIAQERDRARHEARRRAAGAMERAAYESASASQTKPWEALGMSRRSWYRAGKPLEKVEGVAQMKPWEALGMSRATWYRRGKPMPQATDETVLAQVRPYY